MGQPRHLFRFFRSFQTNNNFTTNICEKCPSSIRCRDSNPRPSEPLDQGSRPKNIYVCEVVSLNPFRRHQMIDYQHLCLGIALLFEMPKIVEKEAWLANFLKFTFVVFFKAPEWGLGRCFLFSRSFTCSSSTTCPTSSSSYRLRSKGSRARALRWRLSGQRLRQVLGSNPAPVRYCSKQQKEFISEGTVYNWAVADSQLAERLLQSSAVRIQSLSLY